MLFVKLSCIGWHENATVHGVTDDELTLRQWVGRAVRQIREHHGQRQDDLARSAREVGLTWTSSKISALERGDKALPAEELLLLPLVLARAGCGSPTLADLLPNGPNMVRLGERLALPARVLAESLEYADPDDVDNPVVSRERTMSRCSFDAWFSTGNDPQREAAAIRTMWPQMPGEPYDVARAWHGAGDAERIAARRLEVPFSVVLAAAMATWNHSLTEERDVRAAQRAGPDASARSAQAARGHVTRELYGELTPAIERYRKAEQGEES